MQKKQTLIIGIIVFVVLILIAFLYTKMRGNLPQWQNLLTPTVSVSEGKIDQIVEGFHLTGTYQGNSMWGYKIAGTLPTPCTQTEVRTMVAESYPEQVTIALFVPNPDPNVVCIQTIKDFYYEGNFTASEKATVRLTVSRNSVD